jgi:hypothetical protein
MAGKLPKQIQKLLDIIEGREKIPAETIKNPLKAKLGYLYLMIYDAKWKDKLEFWDALPMFVLLGKSGDRFIGANFHYLPWSWRKSLLTQFMKRLSWKKRYTYKDIKDAFQAAKIPMGYLMLCIRTYLYSHIRSEIKEFNNQNYDVVVDNVMPKFKKASEEYIYKTLMSRFYKKVGGVNPKKK